MTRELRTILEVEKSTGVPRKTLRFYEGIGLIRPGRSDNGYRIYDDRTVERVRFII